MKKCLEYLNSIPHINHGGCGVSALAIIQYAENNNIPLANTKLVLAYDIMDRIVSIIFPANDRMRMNETWVNGQKGNVSIPSHIFFQTGDEYWDCSGKVDTNDYIRLDTLSLTVGKKFLKQLDNDPEQQWNPLFNRDKYIPLIKSNLSVTL